MSWLIDFSLKAALLLGTARVAAWLLRRSPADVRHRLWVAALFGVAILALPIRFPHAVKIDVPVEFSVSTLSAALPARVGTGALSLWTAIWVAGIIAALAKLLAGVATVASWTRRARRVDGVFISESATTPLTWGFLRPVILFPACATEWPASRLDLALRHEEAHVARRDWLWQMLANAMNAVFWFHPLVWLANAELRREAESATDDMVLASGVDATDYAEQLVQVARSISGIAPLAAVPMARSKILESRVREILDPVRQRGQASLWARAAVAVLACACVVPLLALQEQSAMRSSDAETERFVRNFWQHLDPAAAPTPTETVAAPAGVTRGNSAPESAQATPPAPAVAPVPRTPTPASSPDIVLPVPIYKSEPQYTEDARRAKVQGSVRLSVTIDEQGLPSEIKVLLSLDAGLDEQAVEAVRQWRFAPATRDGVAIPYTAIIEVNFRLL